MHVVRIAVVGSSGHAKSVSEAAESAGLVVESTHELGEPGDTTFDHLLSSLKALDFDSVGLSLGAGDNQLRESAYKAVGAAYPNAFFPPIVHSTAWVSSSAHLGPGSVVLAHASVGAGARVGAGGLVNTGSSLDHDSEMKEFSSLAPGARTGGNVRIGARSMIGLQAGILQGRSVGDDSAIGAHSLVIEDIPPFSVGMGTPCRVTRSRVKDEPHY